jgi:hypothetical protein
VVPPSSEYFTVYPFPLLITDPTLTLGQSNVVDVIGAVNVLQGFKVPSLIFKLILPVRLLKLAGLTRVIVQSVV